MSATARQEREMKYKYEKQKGNADLSALDRLRAHVLADGVRSIKSLHRIFKKLDDNGDKKVDLKEFRQALKVLGLVADDQMTSECFGQIDLDSSGTIDSEEFIVALRPRMTSHRKSLVSQAFRKLDRDGSGLVEIEDLQGVYSGTKHKKYLSGEWSEEDVFRQFLNNFNGPNNTSGEVTLDEFEDYYAGVSASIDTDAYFDLMMRQAWKL